MGSIICDRHDDHGSSGKHRARPPFSPPSGCRDRAATEMKIDAPKVQMSVRKDKYHHLLPFGPLLQDALCESFRSLFPDLDS